MRFDPKRRRYLSEKGQVLSPREVRKVVEKYVEAEEKAAEQEAEKVIAGTISATAFFLYMARKIEAWHKVVGRIAYGGRTHMDARREARLERIIDREQNFLKAFQEEVAKASELTRGFVNRAGMYPNAAYSTYENQVLAREMDAGVALGRRVSGDASCPECVAATQAGFQPLDQLAAVGGFHCSNNCRCLYEFSDEVAPPGVEQPVQSSAGIQ